MATVPNDLERSNISKEHNYNDEELDYRIEREATEDEVFQKFWNILRNIFLLPILRTGEEAAKQHRDKYKVKSY